MRQYRAKPAETAARDRRSSSSVSPVRGGALAQLAALANARPETTALAQLQVQANGNLAQLKALTKDKLHIAGETHGESDLQREREADHAFLLEGGVFTEDVLANYISYKRTAEVDAVRLRPHPQEFVMYYGA